MEQYALVNNKKEDKMAKEENYFLFIGSDCEQAYGERVSYVFAGVYHSAEAALKHVNENCAEPTEVIIIKGMRIKLRKTFVYTEVKKR